MEINTLVAWTVLYLLAPVAVFYCAMSVVRISARLGSRRPVFAALVDVACALALVTTLIYLYE